MTAPTGRALLTALATLLAARTALAEAEIDAFPAIGSTRSLMVAGRVLAERVSKDGSALKRNVQRLVTKKLEGVEVTLVHDGETAVTRTGDDGFFEVTFAAPREKPFKPGAHVIEVRAAGSEAQLTAEVLADDAPFLVVSDFDDTIAVTNVVRKRDLLKAALLEDGETQPPVPGMAAFYRCLAKRPISPGFALVSGSPQQYVPRTISFLRKHDFPFAGLYLRDIGPGTLSGYKEPVIRRLLATFPQLPVIAIGDSGEHDPEVYAQIRREFPGRIARIYIRDAGHADNAARFEGMHLFHDAAEPARDAAAAGFADRACVDAAFAPER